MDWLFVSPKADGDLAHFKQLEGYPDDYQLDMGVSLAADFPDATQIKMNPDFKDLIALGDCLDAESRLLIVNEKVRDLFAAEKVTNVEWLSLKVLNHKGKPAKGSYAIANILTQVDCIDVKKSEVQWNDINPELICDAKKIVVDASKLPSDVKIFRPVHLEFEMLIHRSLAKAISDKKLSGFWFREIAEYRY